MKILFLILDFPSGNEESNMYTDLVEEFRDNGHTVTIMAPDNSYSGTYLHKEKGINVLRVRTMHILGVRNLAIKGLGLALLPYQYKRAYKQFLRKESFEWIIMPTPPITLIDFVIYLKRKFGFKFYLILRDIHPQSAASIGLINNRITYNYLAKRAAKAYKIANFIGCMSQGNIDFIASNYQEIDKSKLVLLMNWQKYSEQKNNLVNLREKYRLNDKYIALFGGNIGLGQKVENITKLARHYKGNPSIVFLIIGKGVKKNHLKGMAMKENLNNIKFVDFMPRNEYLDFIRTADVGLISINEHYKVPTCPSKAVSYMSLKVPILAIINPNNDYGSLIENAGAGFWAIGGDDKRIFELFDRIFNDKSLRGKMGENGYKYYLENLTSEHAYNNIMTHISSNG